MDLTDIYKRFHPTASQYIFFSSIHETFSRMEYMLDHKTSHNKFQKIKIIPTIVSNRCSMKLKITGVKLESSQLYRK